MTTLAMVLPWRRSSPLHIPARDMVLAASDNLALAVTVVERDDPGALALDLIADTGNPGLRLIVTRSHHWRHDYGWCDHGGHDVLASIDGTISPDLIGTFNVALPAGTMADWPRRCGFALVLTYDTGAETLASGTLNVAPSP